MPKDILYGYQPYVRRGRSYNKAILASASKANLLTDPVIFPKSWTKGIGTRSPVTLAASEFHKGAKAFLALEFFKS